MNTERPIWMLSDDEKTERQILLSIPYHDRTDPQKRRLETLEKKYAAEGAILDAIH